MPFKFKDTTLLLNLALEVIFFLLERIASLQRLGQMCFTLPGVLEFGVGLGNTGRLVQNHVATLDLSVDVAPMLIDALLLKFQSVLGCSNGVLQGIEALLQRCILLCPSAGGAFLDLQALEFLIAGNDGVFLLYYGLVIGQTVAMRHELLLEFKEFMT